MAAFEWAFVRTPSVGTTGEPESSDWVRALQTPGPDLDAATELLYGMLVGVAHAEVRRRSGQLRITGPEADDLAHQAAGDALMAISAKLAQFRGESRFTTWAYKFVILEVATKVGRHFWRAAGAHLEVAEWDRIPDHFDLGPSEASELRDLVGALRRGIERELTAHQRRVFVAVVVDEVPIDAVAVQLGSNRNAIYKALFEARRRLRAALVGSGHLPSEQFGPV
jgi:RNA polymerase sigma-70 factor, ECF subfamily